MERKDYERKNQMEGAVGPIEEEKKLVCGYRVHKTRIEGSRELQCIIVVHETDVGEVIMTLGTKELTDSFIQGLITARNDMFPGP